MRLDPSHRDRLGRALPVLVVVALLVAGVGGWLTYTAYADPGTRTETRTVTEWSTTPAVEHSAVVSEDNEVFPVGDRLSDRPVYYTQVMPMLDGTYRFGYAAAGGGDVTARTELTLVVRSVAEGDGTGAGTVYWSVTEGLGSAERASLGPGGTLDTSFSLNASRLAGRLERITESLGGTSGQVEVAVRARTRVEGTVDGSEVSRTVTTDVPMDVSASTYSIGPAPGGQPFSRTREVQVERSYGPLWTVGGPLLLVVGLLAAVGLGVAARSGRFDLTDRERALLAHDRARSQFDEWVTTGRVPDDALAGATVPVDSLEGLVDVAIDTNERVVEDPDRGRYYVLAGTTTYSYEPPAAVVPAVEAAAGTGPPAASGGADVDDGSDADEGGDAASTEGADDES